MSCIYDYRVQFVVRMCIGVDISERGGSTNMSPLDYYCGRNYYKINGFYLHSIIIYIIILIQLCYYLSEHFMTHN